MRTTSVCRLRRSLVDRPCCHLLSARIRQQCQQLSLTTRPRACPHQCLPLPSLHAAVISRSFNISMQNTHTALTGFIIPPVAAEGILGWVAKGNQKDLYWLVTRPAGGGGGGGQRAP